MADTLDLLTLAEARLAIDVSTGHTAEIERAVTAVSRRIDDLCGPVVVRTVTDEEHDATGGPVLLDHQPVSSVTTVTQYRSGTGTALTAETIDTAGTYRVVDGTLFRRSGFVTQAWEGTVQVTYEAGRYADTESVDPLFKMAAGSILRRIWDREAGAWARGADPFEEGLATSSRFFNAVKYVVDELLSDEKRAPVIG